MSEGTGIGARKSHKKSRLGCSNCKRRRIKCDEARPGCLNCSKHSIHCDYTQQSSSQSASTDRSLHEWRSPQQFSPSTMSPLPIGDSPNSLIQQSTTSPVNSHSILGGLNVEHLELLHNYCTTTCYTVTAANPAFQTVFRINVPQIGFSHKFVMHGIFAISALHLATFKKDRHDYYIAQADYHYDIGLRTATALIPNINDENCHALFIFANICCAIHFAKGPKPGDFIVFGEHGVSEWLMLFRGVRSIIESKGDLLAQGPLAPIFQSSLRIVMQPYDASMENEHLHALREYLVDILLDDQKREMYLATLEDLARSFAASTGADGEYGLKPHPSTVGAWLYRLSDDFVQDLQQKHAPALVLLAHFCILLNELLSTWWVGGWVNHLMSGIYTSLSEGDRVWIRWPMEQVGWIPPN